MISGIAHSLLSASQIPTILRSFAKRKGNYVALFHGVHKMRFDIHRRSQSDLLFDEFVEIINWLERRFNFITPDQLFDSSVRGGVLLTFDDGFKNNFTNVFPYLEKKKIPALYFISTQHIIDPKNWLWFANERAAFEWERPINIPNEFAMELFDGMSSQNLITMAASKYVYIGAHTVSHPDLPEIPLVEAEKEITESKFWLENLINKKVDYFAYPRGMVTDLVSEVCSRNFKASFCVDSYKKNDTNYIQRISIHSHKKAYLDLKFSPFHKPIVFFNLADSPLI